MKEVRFKIPMLPPSINETYKINYHKKNCYLSAKARDFKFKCKLVTPKLEFPAGTKLETVFIYHGKWHYKNGNIKRKDGYNLDKVLADAVFEKLGIDDSLAFKGRWEKVEDEEEFTEVIIRGYVEDTKKENKSECRLL